MYLDDEIIIEIMKFLDFNSLYKFSYTNKKIQSIYKKFQKYFADRKSIFFQGKKSVNENSNISHGWFDEMKYIDYKSKRFFPSYEIFVSFCKKLENDIYEIPLYCVYQYGKYIEILYSKYRQSTHRKFFYYRICQGFFLTKRQKNFCINLILTSKFFIIFESLGIDVVNCNGCEVFYWENRFNLGTMYLFVKNSTIYCNDQKSYSLYKTLPKYLFDNVYKQKYVPFPLIS